MTTYFKPTQNNTPYFYLSINIIFINIFIIWFYLITSNKLIVCFYFLYTINYPFKAKNISIVTIHAYKQQIRAMILNLEKIICACPQQIFCTIEELAESSESSVNFISMLELEQLNNIKLQKLTKISTALQLDFQNIFGFPEITDSPSIELIHRFHNYPRTNVQSYQL